MSERAKEFVPPAVMLVLGLAFLAWSFTYEGRAHLVPVMVGWTIVVLSIFDVIAQADTVVGRVVKAFFTGPITGEAEAGERQPWRKTLIVIAWPIAFLVAVYFFGFLPVIPIYVFLFMVLQGRMETRTSLFAAVIVGVSIYLIFELALRYTLYRGIVFGAL